MHTGEREDRNIVKNAGSKSSGVDIRRFNPVFLFSQIDLPTSPLLGQGKNCGDKKFQKIRSDDLGSGHQGFEKKLFVSARFF